MTYAFTYDVPITAEIYARIKEARHARDFACPRSKI